MRKLYAALAFIATVVSATVAFGDGLSVPFSQVQTTWTPTLVGSTSGSWTLSTAVGFYEQTGRLVTLRFTITASGSSSPVGAIQIGGLPLTSNATANNNGVCSIAFQTGLTNTAGFTSFGGVISPGVVRATLVEIGSGQTSANADVARAGATPTIIGWCQYST